MPRSERDAFHTNQDVDGLWYSDEEQMGIPETASGVSSRTPGESTSLRDDDDNRKATERAARRYKDQVVGQLEASLPDLGWQNLTPEDMVAAQETEQYALGPSQAEGVYADPQSIAAERAALEQLQQMASQGGYTAGDRARIREGQRSAGAYAASQRGAIENQARARGMGGSGMELAALLGASQGGANMNAASTDAATRAGEARAFEALQMSGQLGSQMRGESFGEGGYRAEAADARDVYDNEQLRQMQQRNVEREQQTRGMNTETRNRFMQGNADAQRRYAQQAWSNQGSIADRRLGLVAQQDAARRERERQEDEDSSNMWAAGLGALGTVAGAVIGGPVGAAAGGAAGGAIGRGIT